MSEERQKGSITVEATLFIPIFLFAFLSIYSLVTFARAQLLVQYAADQAAREVAQYSYILEKTGILEAYINMEQSAGEFQSDLDNVKTNLQQIDELAQKIVSGHGTADDSVELGNAGKDMYENVQGYVSNPKEFINGAISALKAQSWEALASYMIGTVGKSSVLNQLAVASGSDDPESYLGRLGVSGLSFDNSSWCENGNKEVKIVVDYQIKSSFPFFDLPSKHYRVCASTRIWSGL